MKLHSADGQNVKTGHSVLSKVKAACFSAFSCANTSLFPASPTVCPDSG